MSVFQYYLFLPCLRTYLLLKKSLWTWWIVFIQCHQSHVGGGVGGGGGWSGGKGFRGVCHPLCKICFKIANCFQQSMPCTPHWSSRVLHALFNNSPDDCRLPSPPTKSYPQTATDMENTIIIIHRTNIFSIPVFAPYAHVENDPRLACALSLIIHG